MIVTVNSDTSLLVTTQNLLPDDKALTQHHVWLVRVKGEKVSKDVIRGALTVSRYSGEGKPDRQYVVSDIKSLDNDDSDRFIVIGSSAPHDSGRLTFTASEVRARQLSQ